MNVCLRNSCNGNKTTIKTEVNNGISFLVNVKHLHANKKWDMIVKQYEEIRNDPLLKFDTVSYEFYDYILEAYHNCNKKIHIVKFVNELKAQDAVLGNITYEKILNAFDFEQILNKSYDFLEELRKNKKIKLSQKLYELIMFAYLKLDDKKKVKEVIEEIYINKIPLCNNTIFLILVRYLQAKDYDSIIDLYYLLSKQPFDLRISEIYIKASEDIGNSIVAWEQFLLISETYYKFLDKDLIIRVLKSFKKYSASAYALKVLGVIKNLQLPIDKDIYKQVFFTFQRKEDYHCALKLLNDMEQANLEIDIDIYNVILSLARINLDWDKIRDILNSYIFKNDINPTLETFDIAIDCYLNSFSETYCEIIIIDDEFIGDKSTLDFKNLYEQIKKNKIEFNALMYVKLLRLLYLYYGGKVNLEILELLNDAIANKKFSESLSLRKDKTNPDNYILEIDNNIFLLKDKIQITDDFALIVIAYHLGYLQGDFEILLIYDFQNYEKAINDLNIMFKHEFSFNSHYGNSYLIRPLKKKKHLFGLL